VLRWLDKPLGRTLPTTIGVSLAALLTMAGAAVAGQAGHQQPAAGSTSDSVAAALTAPHTEPSPARPGRNSRPSPPRSTRTMRTVAPMPAAPALALAGITPDAAAAWSARGLLPPVTHPQADRLGSTICSHEQCDPPPTAALASLAAVRADRQQPASTGDPAQAQLTASPTTTPTDPAPTDPAPTDPAPTDPAPTDPAPTDPAPIDPAPTDPAPISPVSGAGSPLVPGPTGLPTLMPAPTHAAPPVSVPPSTPAGGPGSATSAPAPVVRPPSVAPAPPTLSEGGPSPQGVHVSSYQGSVDWLAAFQRGARFAYVKATESTRYTNPSFSQQYNGSQRAGLVRGAYHFALPDRSDGATQAQYFLAHGGGWSPDGSTLPPMLDIEYNPYGSTCYGLSRPQMTRWVNDFSTVVHSRTGRFPIIYSTDPGAMPNGWRYQTIWQYNDNGPLPGDQDLFNGSYADLRRFALGI